MEKKIIKIAAIGDSLTEGYYNRGKQFHPYASKLQELLSERFLSHKIEVTQFGVSGEQTTSMKKRLSKLVSTKYDYVIILGGTNDLAFQSGETIFDNLQSMYEMVINHEGIPVGVSIPEKAQDMRFPAKKQLRVEINESIQKFCEDQNYPFVDLAVGIPQLGLEKEEVDKYWDDSIHLNPLGYDRFGELIFEKVSEHILSEFTQ